MRVSIYDGSWITEWKDRKSTALMMLRYRVNRTLPAPKKMLGAVPYARR